MRPMHQYKGARFSSLTRTNIPSPGRRTRFVPFVSLLQIVQVFPVPSLPKCLVQLLEQLPTTETSDINVTVVLFRKCSEWCKCEKHSRTKYVKIVRIGAKW